MNRWAWTVLAITVSVITFSGLFTGADWLLVDLGRSGLPLGTLATSLTLVLLPVIAFVWAPSRFERILATLMIVAGAAWWPVSAVAAGNVRLNFEDAPDWWWPVTQGLPALSLALVLWVGLRWGVRGRRARWRDPDLPLG